MTSIKIDARSQIGEMVAADIKSGAMKFDESKGAFCKPSTDQEYLITNKDRIVRWDGVVKSFSEYNTSIKNFLPINALEDGEQVDRTRKLKQNDILAKPTWGQWAEEATLTIAQGAVLGAALGTIGGAVYGIATHRRAVHHDSNSANGVPSGNVSSNSGRSGIGVSRAALHAVPFNGPFNPGNLHPPPPLIINPPPPREPGMAQVAQEQMAQGAFGAAGAAVGALGGPVGAIIGGLVGIGVGAIWNEAVR